MKSLCETGPLLLMQLRKNPPKLDLNYAVCTRGKNSETNVKIPMMTCVEHLHYLNVDTYSAVALPLAEGLREAFFIVVVPKANLTDVEMEIFGSGTLLHSFLENVRSSHPRLIRMSLPRLTLQITHEWATRTNESLGEIQDKAGKPLQGLCQLFWQEEGNVTYGGQECHKYIWVRR